MSSTSYIPDFVDVKIKATHFEFVNKNAVYYTKNAIDKGAKSWVTPYKKPKLVGHDTKKDPIGRITAYNIVMSDATDQPPNYVELTAHITDKDAISKILDGRYNTVSVGSRTSRVICSECQQVITEDGLCEHKKGTYNASGKQIHWLIDQIDYTESSFVNDPADEYAAIDQIDLGTGWLPYQQFLDHREIVLSEIQTEDALMENNSVALATTTRNNLPDSVFCYVVTKDGSKIRKFPAHDAAHVKNGLVKLAQAKLTDSVKNKIKSTLYRKGKRFGIIPTKDEVDALPDLLIYRMGDEFTADEILSIDELFTADPELDTPKDEQVPPTATEATATSDSKDPTAMKKNELLDYLKGIEDAHKTALETKDKSIVELTDAVKQKDTILSERDNEIQKLLDENALINTRYRDSLVNHIVDLRVLDGDKATKDELIKKYTSRKAESLIDSLSDLRPTDIVTDTNNTEPIVVDPTTVANTPSVNENQDASKGVNPFSIFDEDRTLTEVE
jgi:hypothetical protein